ncbi:MAG: hypothetical protein DHS20C08_09080 [Rhodomicrobium sp.]|nr:MAG: hypothetical protein DHS20C08_09080 [Rhodomicrobium sp.]
MASAPNSDIRDKSPLKCRMGVVMRFSKRCECDSLLIEPEFTRQQHAERDVAAGFAQNGRGQLQC